MTSSVENGNLSMCAISLEHKDDFCASPPFGFHVAENTGRMVCEDSSVIVLVRDTKFEGRDVVIEVGNVVSLKSASPRSRHRSIFLRLLTNCMFQVTSLLNA